MAHSSNVIHPAGPDSPHAFDNIPLHPRNGTLDAPCPVCKGHGQWNAQIDLISFRCQRTICGHCLGSGWIETGTDPIAVTDIVLRDGAPQWITRYVPAGETDRR